jgi:hypothetical protein
MISGSLSFISGSKHFVTFAVSYLWGGVAFSVVHHVFLVLQSVRLLDFEILSMYLLEELYNCN